MRTDPRRPTADVLGIYVDAVNMEKALDRTRALLETGQPHYICAAAVHGIVEAQHNRFLLGAYDGAAMVMPDGMPLVWTGHTQGHAAMERVTGPDLMLEIFRRSEFANVTHFLYGGDPGVAEELRDRLTAQFPSARIVGVYTPPFRELNAAEELDLENRFASLRPDIIWVGIGCPKQELCMARYAPHWHARLMIGVGAAFNFHTGRIRDCAPWVKHAGLQWLHRFLQDPRRLWRRYLVTNSIFICEMTLQALAHYGAKAQPKPRTAARESADVRAPSPLASIQPGAGGTM